MKKKLKKFEVEELEQRFETGRWISEIKGGLIYEHSDKWTAQVSATWELE